MLCFSGKTEFNPENVTTLEDWIDTYHNQLPPLRNFILPVSIEEEYLYCCTVIVKGLHFTALEQTTMYIIVLDI